MERPEIHGLVSLEINPSIGGFVIMMFFFPFGGICDRSLEAIFWARASPEENSEIDFQRKGNRPFNSVIGAKRGLICDEKGLFF